METPPPDYGITFIWPWVAALVICVAISIVW